MTCGACLSCLPHTWHTWHARPGVAPCRAIPLEAPKPFLPGTRVDLWCRRRRRNRGAHLPDVPRLRRSVVMPAESPADAVVKVGEFLVAYGHGRVYRVDPAMLDDLARQTLPAHADKLAAFYKRHPRRWAEWAARSVRQRADEGLRRESERQAEVSAEVDEWRKGKATAKVGWDIEVSNVLPYLFPRSHVCSNV